MDIPVNAAKPGRRRYLTLVMIFITVVICYVDRANWPWLLPIFRKSLVLLKRKWAMYFRPSRLYTLCQIPGGWFRSRRFTRDLFYCDIWLVSGDVIPWFLPRA